MAVIVKQMRDPLPKPTLLNPNLPEEAERVLFKALAKNPNDRYADMSAFAAALENLPRTESKYTKQKPARILPEKEKLPGERSTSIKKAKDKKPFDTRWLIGAMGVAAIGLMMFSGIKLFNGAVDRHPTPFQEIQITTETPQMSAHPTLTLFQTQTPILHIGSTEVPSLDDVTIILSDIQLYDDFNSSDIDLTKWSPPVWDPNQQFSPILANGNLEFEITEGWADWAINQPKQIKEIQALVTLESPYQGAIGITLRNLGGGYGFYGLMLKNNSVAIWDLEENELFKVTSGLTHLLGARMDGQKIEFFSDDESIGIYPLDGYPNYGTLQIVSGGSITRGHFDNIWIKFLE